jgi:TM2 domain-containing membrane protein YozV
MKENVKAALLSALVLPGVGQFYRGRTVKGGILVALVSVMLLIFIVLAVLAVQDILHVVRITGTIDAVALAESLRGRVPSFLWLGGVLFCVWTYGVVDAFLGSASGSEDEKGK